MKVHKTRTRAWKNILKGILSVSQKTHVYRLVDVSFLTSERIKIDKFQ